MNILIDINPLKQKNLSGVGKYLQEVLSRLLILDKDNQYFLFSYGRKNKDLAINLPTAQNIHYIHRQIPSKLILILSFFGLFKLDVFKSDGKIIKADLVWLPNLGIANLKFKETRLITTIHDLSFQIYPQFFNFKRRLWHFLVRPRQVIKRSDKIIAVSENTALDIQNIYQVPQNKIMVMNLGVDQRYRILERSELEIVKSKYNLKRDFILFLGTKEPRKNILSLLKAFKKFQSSDLELLIVGGRGWKEKRWRAFYEDLEENIKSRIKIIDYIREEDLPALYNLAKIFVWPSFYEGFGLPVLEALACACPVITANNSSLPSVVKDRALLIEAFNVNNLFSAMYSLLKNKELYNFYKNSPRFAGEAGKEFDQNYYSNWDKSAEKLLNLFKKV